MYCSSIWGKDCKSRALNAWKNLTVHHNNTDLFLNLPNPLTATRYHSLLIEPASMPDCLGSTARTKDEKCKLTKALPI